MNAKYHYFNLVPIDHPGHYVSQLIFISDKLVSKQGEKIGLIGFEVPLVSKKKMLPSKIKEILTEKMIVLLSKRQGLVGNRGHFKLPNACSLFNKAVLKRNQ